MRILFYAPFKPLDHVHPSGDLVTAAGIVDYLTGCGHQVDAVSSLRCRWIYWKPWLWPGLIVERHRLLRRYFKDDYDLWLTYHTYYKAPDMLGPSVAHQLQIPYVVFQGIYATKRRRKLKTLPGFYLNKHALVSARHVFVNKTVDWANLKRLLPSERISYLAPGIYPEQFCFDQDARQALRKQWKIGDESVVFSAAMFRPDVKSEGLTWVIRACSELLRRGNRLRLVIAGDGREGARLQQMAKAQLHTHFDFVGKIPRSQMYRYYSAGDIFVFPGIRESLGMVFLEAQSCGLPVVAFANAGVPEAVQDGRTGFLVPMYAAERFTDAIERLLQDKDLRCKMGRAARTYVRQAHDLNQNYQKMEHVLQNTIQTLKKD